ncbi:hypothetical protein CS063_12370 [Sporanaerobium hydrogeniformans]|uniref:Uncharacterized protein n=1 Tax=Sporanaerobium hydrogeniformans TaxID=3072179 RepID=A0AC61DBD5_9FIRM|nr:YcxB family protein [Sporanaerobium hydrogeniformans]PHV70093.1 hypothetical protein CS063_12370 [Sporanaerobium hydrogeniformans]
MEKIPIQIDTHMDVATFRAFSHFNSFKLNNRFITLALFPVVMFGLAVINAVTGSSLFFWLLISLGILLPSSYLIFYKVAMERQITLHGLDTPKKVYSLIVNTKGLYITSQTEKAHYRWNQIYRLFVMDDSIYIYLTKARAFILPYKDFTQGTPEELLALAQKNLPSVRLFDKCSKKD